MRERQNGFSLVAMTVILFSTVLLIMTALNRQLSMQLRINHQERQYIQSYNRAASSLNWGLHQIWHRPGLAWHCQHARNSAYNACIKRSLHSEKVLLKNGNIDNDDLILYLLAEVNEASGTEKLPHGDIRLVRHASGWLDYCPERFCD